MGCACTIVVTYSQLWAIQPCLEATDLLLTAVLQVANKCLLPSELKCYSSRLTISTANDSLALAYTLPFVSSFSASSHISCTRNQPLSRQLSINIFISPIRSLSDPVPSLPICHLLSSPQFITLTGSTALYLFPHSLIHFLCQAYYKIPWTFSCPCAIFFINGSF